MKFRILLLLLLLIAGPIISQEKKNGKTSYTDSLGNLHSGQNKKAMHVGEWTVKDKKGIHIATLNYKDGIYHGRYTSYYANGKVRWYGDYNNGKNDAVWVAFDDKGDTVRIETIVNDTLHGPAV